MRDVCEVCGGSGIVERDALTPRGDVIQVDGLCKCKIVQEDFSGTICDPKWRSNPTSTQEADRVIKGMHCPLCCSPLLLAILRPPVNVWKVHCNHCATEIPIVVLLNRVAWMV